MNNIDREGLLLLFVAGLPDAVTLLDVDGNILTWNAGARDMTGYATDEILGRHFSCLYTPRDVDAGKPALALRSALERGRHEEVGDRVRKDGTEFKVQSVLMPLYDSRKVLLGFGGQMRGTAASSGAAPNVADTALVPRQPGETILVVDDDEHVREGVLHQLTSLGYRTVAASNGPEALDVLAHEPCINLLFTDVVMPGGMNGREVAERARLLNPDLKVLFTSGYFEVALLRNGKLDANEQFLTKPYRKKELAEKVQEVLRSTAAA